MNGLIYKLSFFISYTHPPYIPYFSFYTLGEWVNAINMTMATYKQNITGN